MAENNIFAFNPRMGFNSRVGFMPGTTAHVEFAEKNKDDSLSSEPESTQETEASHVRE